MHIINPYRYGGVTTYVHDTFTDSDNTDLESHTPDIDVIGGGWNVDVNPTTWEVISNKSAFPAAAVGTADHAVIDCGQSDIIVTADITFSSDQGPGYEGLILRANSSTPFADHWIAIHHLAKGKFVISERTSSTFTDRAEIAWSPSAGSTYTFKFVASGTSLIATIDDGFEINYTSSQHQANTLIGQRAQHQPSTPSSVSTLDEFLATSL